MRHRLAVIAVVASIFWACVSPGPGSTTTDPARRATWWAITHTNVLPMDGDQALADHTVLVRGDTIAAVAPSDSLELPSGASVVDGRGLWLLPGLADMHAHLPRGEEPFEPSLDSYFDLCLAAGVTTLRTMRGADGDVALRDAVAAGRREGPRLVVGSPALDGAGAPDPDAAARAVHDFARAGYDFVKVLEGMDVASFDAILAAARRDGLPVAGHLPDGIDPERVMLGYWTLEHLHGHAGARLGDPDGFAALARRTAACGLVLCPTLAFQVGWFGQASLEAMRAWPGVCYADPRQVAEWQRQVRGQLASIARTPQARSRNDAAMQARLDAVAELDAASVPLLVSPSGGWFLVPGFSMLVEMRWLERAGLRRPRILAAATEAAARACAASDRWGAVRPGLAADFVVLDGDPRRDLGQLEHPRGVMRRGVFHDRSDLDRRLAAVVAAHRAAVGAAGRDGSKT